MSKKHDVRSFEPDQVGPGEAPHLPQPQKLGYRPSFWAYLTLVAVPFIATFKAEWTLRREMHEIAKQEHVERLVEAKDARESIYDAFELSPKVRTSKDDWPIDCWELPAAPAAARAIDSVIFAPGWSLKATPKATYEAISERLNPEQAALVRELGPYCTELYIRHAMEKSNARPASDGVEKK